MAYKWRWPVTAATALLTVAVCSSASQVGAANHEFFATNLKRWFRELTDKALRRGAFHSVHDLIASIQEYIDSHNDAPRPYMWAATAQSILAKVARGRIALEKVYEARSY